MKSSIFWDLTPPTTCFMPVSCLACYLTPEMEETKYMLPSRHQNAGLNHDVNIGKCFEYVAQFLYLVTTITNQNLIQEGIKRGLNSGNACYHSIQNLLSSRLLSKS
jgi:hypothetical protein